VATTPHREDVTPETFDVTRGPFALVFGTEHASVEQVFRQYGDVARTHGDRAAKYLIAFGCHELRKAGRTRAIPGGFDPNPDIARGTDQWVDVRRHSSTAGALAALRRDGDDHAAHRDAQEFVGPGNDLVRYSGVLGAEDQCERPASRCAAWSKA